MREPTKYAIDTFRKFYGSEHDYNPIVLGSIHNLEFKYDRIIDWTTREGKQNANYFFDEINQGSWNLVLNCCCEHMMPMRLITLKGIYVLQINDLRGDPHINPCREMDAFVDQCKLDFIIYSSEISYNTTKYLTLIGEKY